jgi:AP-1 complex subunit gamma-1
MLTIAGRESARNVQSASIIYISRSSDDLQAYATHKLLKAIRDDDGSQRGLLVVAIWCIGEYGDLLLKPYAYTPPSSNDISSVTAAAPSTEYFSANDAASVVNTVEEVTKRHTCPDDVKQRALTCYAKLSDRFANTGDVQTLNKLQSLIKKHSKSQLLELQLRSCEYDALVNALKGVVPTKSTSANNDIFGMDLNSDEGVNKKVQAAAKEALARMPVVDLSVLQRKRATDVDFDGDNDTMIAVKQPPQKQVGGDLLDLNDIFGSAPESSASNVAMENGQTNTSTSTSQETKSDIDLLSDIFSASTMPSMPPTQIPSSNPIDIFGSQPAATPISVATPSPAPAINDIFASSPAPPASNGSVQGPLIVHGFSHGGLTVEFECTKPEVWNKQNSTLVAKFINQTDAPIYGLNLQCAVPKYVKMEMKPPTSTTIPVTAGNAKQVI